MKVLTTHEIVEMYQMFVSNRCGKGGSNGIYD